MSITLPDEALTWLSVWQDVRGLVEQAGQALRVRQLVMQVDGATGKVRHSQRGMRQRRVRNLPIRQGRH